VGEPRARAYWGGDRDAGIEPDDAIYWQACVALRKARDGKGDPTLTELRTKVLELAAEA
jgi:hypothetical protein